MDAPQAQYLERDGALLAYQVVGDGPVDMLLLGEAGQHFDLSWTDPHVHELYERAARYSRAAYMQLRGLGLSEPINYWPTLEQHADDIIAVLDAAGMQRAVLYATLTTVGPLAVAAAKSPERVSAVVLFRPLPTGPLAPNALDFGWTKESADTFITKWRAAFAQWGSGATIETWDPVLGTAYNRRLMALMERCSATPTFARRYLEAAMSVDCTPFLPAIQAPTRVLYAPTGPEPIEVVRVTAELIPNATFHELAPTPAGASIGESFVEVWQHLEEVATGTRPGADANRFLGTLLFTDVASSTELLARIGDAAYSELHSAHERQVRLEVQRAGGRLVSVTGDGTFSVFDGPTKAVRCAAEIVRAASELGLQVRAGVHTGELERTGHYDVTGMSVHIGARIGALAAPGEVWVSNTVRDLVVGSGLAFADRGTHELKGVPGSWPLCALVGTDAVPAPLTTQSIETPLDRAALRTARVAPGVMRAALRVGNAVQRRRART